MISDSITNASATTAPTARDFGKKKRSNRAAKLKQSKLDLRREQWLSQVKREMDSNRSGKSDQRNVHPVGKLVVEEEDKNVTRHHESFIESSLSNSPNSILTGMNSIPNFSSGSSNGSGGGSVSGNITEEEDEEEDDGCVDDWEAIADALEADEDEKEKEIEKENLTKDENPSKDSSSNQAWRPEDKLRPQGLPNLEKQRSFPVMNLRFSTTALTVPSSCPICYEDLDFTDSNFLPCPCGFRLCLFCHKTICDGDGRCPGCRKAYEKNTVKFEASIIQGSGLTIRLARSSSMFCRS